MWLPFSYLEQSRAAEERRLSILDRSSLLRPQFPAKFRPWYPRYPLPYCLPRFLHFFAEPSTWSWFFSLAWFRFVHRVTPPRDYSPPQLPPHEILWIDAPRYVCSRLHAHQHSGSSSLPPLPCNLFSRFPFDSLSIFFYRLSLSFFQWFLYISCISSSPGSVRDSLNYLPAFFQQLCTNFKFHLTFVSLFTFRLSSSSFSLFITQQFLALSFPLRYHISIPFHFHSLRSFNHMGIMSSLTVERSKDIQNSAFCTLEEHFPITHWLINSLCLVKGSILFFFYYHFSIIIIGTVNSKKNRFSIY